jgi:hypothetical protein
MAAAKEEHGLSYEYQYFWVRFPAGKILADHLASLQKYPPIKPGTRLSIALIAAAIGLLHGYLNGQALGLANAGTQELLGIATSALVVIILGSAGAAILGVGKGRMILRVLGSWLAAVGLLLFGWDFRGQR